MKMDCKAFFIAKIQNAHSKDPFSEFSDKKTDESDPFADFNSRGNEPGEGKQDSAKGSDGGNTDGGSDLFS